MGKEREGDRAIINELRRGEEERMEELEWERGERKKAEELKRLWYVPFPVLIFLPRPCHRPGWTGMDGNQELMTIVIWRWMIIKI